MPVSRYEHGAPPLTRYVLVLSCGLICFLACGVRESKKGRLTGKGVKTRQSSKAPHVAGQTHNIRRRYIVFDVSSSISIPLSYHGTSHRIKHDTIRAALPAHECRAIIRTQWRHLTPSQHEYVSLDHEPRCSDHRRRSDQLHLHRAGRRMAVFGFHRSGRTSTRRPHQCVAFALHGNTVV